MPSEQLLSRALHPLSYLIIQKSIVILLLAFTDPGSIIRAAPLPIILLCNYYLLPTYALYIPRPAWIGFVAGEILATALDFLEKVLISQWSFVHNGPSTETRTTTQDGWGNERQSNSSGSHPTARISKLTSSEPRSSISNSLSYAWKRLKFGTWVGLSNRYIGSPYQARNTPPYSTSNPNYIPKQGAYLLRRGSVFLACYLITDILLLGNQPTLNPIVYAEKHVSLFPRLISGEVPIAEILTRVGTTLGFWIGAYFMIQGYNSATGFLAVASGLSSPSDRRPIFGSPADAYSIRRFWGVFWHQLTRKKFTTIADCATFPILRLLHLPSKPHTILPRYTQLVLVFLISGLLHQTLEVAQGLPWHESGAIEFFLLMAGGIIAEDVMVWVWGRLARQGGKRGEIAWWQKAIGYVWVVFFFSWATPTWAYPSLRRNTGGTEYFPLPFSIVGLFLKLLKSHVILSNDLNGQRGGSTIG